MGSNKNKHSSLSSRKLWKQRAVAKAGIVSNEFSSLKTPKKTISRTKTGAPKSNSKVNQLRITLSAASARGSGRKPSMPKMPWDNEDKAKEEND